MNDRHRRPIETGAWVTACAVAGLAVSVLVVDVVTAELAPWEPTVSVLSEPILIAADGDEIPFDSTGLGGDMFDALPQDVMTEHETAMVDDAIAAINYERTQRGIWELQKSDHITAVMRRWVEQLSSNEASYPMCKPHPGELIFGQCDVDSETQLAMFSLELAANAEGEAGVLNSTGGGATGGASTQTAGGFISGLVAARGNHYAAVLGFQGRFAGVGLKCMPDGRSFWTWLSADYDAAYRFADPAFPGAPFIPDDDPPYTPNNFGRRCPQPGSDWTISTTGAGVQVDLTSPSGLTSGRLELDGPVLALEFQEWLVEVIVTNNDTGEVVFEAAQPYADFFSFLPVEIGELPVGEYIVAVRQLNDYETTQVSVKPLSIVDLPDPAGSTGARFEASDPRRLVDTRSGDGGRMLAGTVRAFILDLPASTAAITANVTAVGPGGNGHLRLWPCAPATTSTAGMPATSNVNFAASIPATPNQVTVEVDENTICVYAHAATDVLIDLSGIWTTADAGVGFDAVTAERIYDSRLVEPAARRSAGSVLRLPAVAAPGAAAVTLNVTATNTLAPGYITVYGCESTGDVRPVVSNLNVAPGVTRPNLVTVKVPFDGSICIYTHSGTALIVDVVGEWTVDADSTLTAFNPPQRLVDTRSGDGGRLVGGVDRQVIDETDSNVIVNVTAADPDRNGWLAAFSCAAGYGGTSNVNYAPGRNGSTAVIVDASDGGVCVRASAGVDVIVDQFADLGSG